MFQVTVLCGVFFSYSPPSRGGISVYEVILSKPRDTKKMFAVSVKNTRRRKKRLARRAF